MNIFIFGPSCAGKSTLALALKEKLGQEWIYLDKDSLVEEEGFDERFVQEEIDKRISSLTHVIVDNQVPWRKKREGEFFFRILPPLETLLKRDEKRTKKIQRTEVRSKWARHYVINTHKELSELDQAFFSETFDSSKMSIEDEVDQICKTLFSN
ncbi:MAG: hypothetical protein KFB93_05835 [Simkaniaceae bacterium]|nr:MAG: hypothetical protein KFB93_05835 [Simkaniaceae bacterium]